MSPKRTALLAVILTLSLLGNAVLGGLYYLRGMDVEIYRQEVAGLADDREILIRLMPALRPGISSTELAAAIHSRYPGEQVNLSDTQVQWRLFHFRFDTAGKLVDVQWSS